MKLPSRFKQHTEFHPKRIRQVISWLTAPSDAIQEIEHHHQARLLASLLVAFIPLGFLSVIIQLFTIPDFDQILAPLLGSLAILMLAYILSRTHHFKIGAIITVAVPTLAVFANLLIDPTNTDTLYFIILSILLSSVLFPWRWTLALVIAILIITNVMIFFIPELIQAQIAVPLTYSMIMSGLILILSKYRDSLETVRQVELNISENRWRMLVNQSPFSTVIYTPDGRLQSFNQAAMTLWNLSPQELEFLRKDYNILKDLQLEAIGILPFIKNGFNGDATVSPPHRYEFKHVDSAGANLLENRWLITYCYPVKDEVGEVIEVVIVHEDITERKQTEELLRRQDRLSAVGQLASGIAHDFNNVLAVIILYSQLLLKSSNLAEKEFQQLQIILEQANRAADLTGQILDFSRQSIIERQPIDLLPFFEDLSKLLKQTMPEHINIKLKTKGNGFFVNADLTRIQQAVMNLANNARDAMSTGGELGIWLEQLNIRSKDSLPLPEMKIGKWMKIGIADNGTGIPSNVLPYLFEPFFTTKEPGKGTGLGLAQVYGIVQQHDGYIDVMSQVGQGTTIIIYLPALKMTQPKKISQDLNILTNGNDETILVVEDDNATRKALAEGLESLNYRVLTARTGQDALATLEKNRDKVALILSDVVMPEMGGRELLQILKQRKINVPVVMLTGHLLGEELDKLRDEGLREWLTKPVVLEELAKVVAQLLHEG